MGRDGDSKFKIQDRHAQAKMENRNWKIETGKPKLENRNWKISNPKQAIQNSRSRSSIENHQSKIAIGNRKSANQNPKSGVGNPKSKIANPKSVDLEPFLVDGGVALDDDVLLGERFEFGEQAALARLQGFAAGNQWEVKCSAGRSSGPIIEPNGR
ncbi:MAG: hypothetical protein WAO35_26000 [Terriglobia bacterium]